jgi:alpha-D-xyloside xylohydrolase
MRLSLTPLPFVFTLFAACTSSPANPPLTDASTSDTPTATDAGCTYDGAADDTPDPTPHTPRWAFEPWISKDISDGPDTYAFVDGFRMRDIPVGAVVLDSPWETHYNTCLPNPSRYPDFPRLVREMHDRNVRVVLWITAFVNQTSYDLEIGGDRYVGPSPNFAEGTACGFYVNDGETYAWWKGRGSSVDFLNARARSWWHRQQDSVLDAGIDGWKLDFGDSYITTETVRTAEGTVPHQRYSEAYYRDFLAYGRARRGADFLTMVRAWDESYQFPGRFFARREHAPVAWMGDNRRDRVGLIDALDHMFRSAVAGYPVVGSDLGGYLDRDDRALMNEIPYDHDTFLRWIALSALTPFMQLHGRGNFTPWTVPTQPEETVRDYRYWAKLHHAMVPFWYALAQEAWRGGQPILRPQGEMNQWPGDYRYMLGEALLVAPVLDETGRRDIPLPAGEWYDWWSPRNDVIAGGSTQRNVDTSDRTRIPLYVRAGAIIPLRVEDDVNALGTTASARALTMLVYPSTTMSRFTLHETDTPAAISAVRATDAASINLPPLTTALYLRVRADRAFQGVTVDGQALPSRASRAELDTNDSGWWSEDTTRSAWVKLPMAAAARVVRLAY